MPRPKKISTLYKKDATKKKKKKPALNPETYLPTGLTLLDLCCSDTIHGGFAPGTINTLPGTSASGKTMLMLSSLACIANDPRFNNYKLI